MNKERDNRPPRLTLEEVTRKAEETALEHGGHIPTLIVEGSRQSTIIQLKEFADTHEQRIQQMLTAGFTLAQEQLIRVPEQVFFITEGWLSIHEEGQEPTVPPSQDPERKEVLVISNLNVLERSSNGVILEMVRDDADHLTALKSYQLGEEQAGQMESPLLAAFIQGIIMGRSGQHGQQ